jgi:hypothetical protein
MNAAWENAASANALGPLGENCLDMEQLCPQFFVFCPTQQICITVPKYELATPLASAFLRCWSADP